MLKVNINETFYNITQDDEALKNAFIDMGFKPMANKQTFQTVGRVITLKKAMEHINMNLDTANAYLKEKGLEVELYE